MNASTITSSTFTLKQGTVAVAGTVAYSGSTATFTPTNNLEANEVYTASITTGVKDIAGIAITGTYSWSFTTAALVDITPPIVLSIVPAGNAVQVALTSKATATFSEAMKASTITSSTFTLNQGTTAVPGTVTYLGTTATFTPAKNLESDKVYTATIATGATDLAGNAIASNYSWNFTTVDITPPNVLSMVPLDKATLVSPTSKVTATFSEAMNASMITTSTFTLKQGTALVAGKVTYTGTIATFTPTNDLEANKVYTATITTGVKDLAGNALAANKEWSFTTAPLVDVIAPTVLSMLPVDNATLIALNSKVTATFSEAMNSSTITTSTFTLKQGTANVAGTVAYSGMTATFTPTNDLLAGKVYTATITTGSKDLAGNQLALNKEWHFTTKKTSLATLDLGSAGNYVILAKTTITNIATSTITGDLGLSPAATSYITGFALTKATGYATASQVTGKLFAADMVSPTSTNLTTAVENMITAYNNAAGRSNPDFTELSIGNIGGKTLVSGLYKWTTNVTLSSDVVISGGADDVWIFQISKNLLVGNGVKITLTGGAQVKNIFWQVAGEATLGITSKFKGIILSKTGITLQTGATMNGRALAQTAVILDKNTVTQP